MAGNTDFTKSIAVFVAASVSPPGRIGTTIFTTALSLRWYLIESAISQNLAENSPAMMRFRLWYQYSTTLFSLPRATTYRFVRIGSERPGTSRVSGSDSRASQPAPGRQFLGECGAWPERCDLKKLMDSQAALPSGFT